MIIIQKHQEVCGNNIEMIQIVNSESFKLKIRVRGKSPYADNVKNFEISLPLKYLTNFWRTLEMPLINCKINLISTWSKNCVIFFCNWSNKNQQQQMQNVMFLL